MSNKMITVLGGLVVGLGLLATTTPGCGGSSGGSGADGGTAGSSATGTAGSSATGAAGSVTSAQIVALCDKVCDKEVACTPSIPSTYAAQCKTSCASSSAGGASGTTTTMTSCPGKTIDQALAMANACLDESCTAFLPCFEAVCPNAGTAGTSGTAGSFGTAGTSGTAGSTGTAGTTGTAGASGGGSTCDTACKKADACSQAIGALGGGGGAGTTGTSLQASCNSVAAGSQASVVASCNMYLTNIAPLLGAEEPAACK